MFKLLSNVPIFRRLFIALALTIVIPGIVIVVLSSFYLNQLNTRNAAVKTSIEAQTIAYQQQINLNRMNALLGERHVQVFATLGGSIQDPSLSANGDIINSDIVARQIDFDQTLAQYQQNFQLATSSNMSTVRDSLLSDDPQSGLIAQQQAAITLVTQKQWPTYKNLQQQELALLNQQGPISYSKAYQILYDANTSFLDLKNSWQRVVDIAGSVGEVITTVGASQLNPIILGAVIGLLLNTLVLFTTGYLLNFTISRPLRGLASLTRRISRGDTSARARVQGSDEIALVANSMNGMLDSIVNLLQETKFQRDNLQAQVEKLVSEVSGVGEGDLRIQAEVTADALGVLADSFNYMVEELGSLIVHVKMVANEVDNSTVAILDRMTQLVESGDMQINQIAEAAIEIERMSASSRQVAERSQVLYDVARIAREDANGGREAVRQAVEGMGRINDNVQLTASKVQDLGERSREIDEIVTVISSIAHQTNRLALDAAIQAAMAGENGKGFGAVAADIRRLAERAKEQVSSITKIVRNVREEVGAVAISMQDTERETTSGTRLTQEAGFALESIFTAVEQQAREIENINKVAIQQLQSSSSVVQIMHAVSESTQQSGASTREASQNMERLARLVEQLRSSVEAFKLRENQGYFFPNTNVSMEDEQDNQMTVSGIFRTVSGGAQPAHQLVGASFASNALPVARPDDSFSTSPRPRYNGDSYDNSFIDQGYNEQQPFLTNGNGRNR
ncbi:MAG: hypothetical protein NVS2B2_22900 [Ktedonobacteraceae bacterium]